MSKKIKWPKLKARGLRGRAGGEHYMDDATACDYIRKEIHTLGEHACSLDFGGSARYRLLEQQRELISDLAQCYRAQPHTTPTIAVDEGCGILTTVRVQAKAKAKAKSARVSKAAPKRKAAKAAPKRKAKAAPKTRARRGVGAGAGCGCA